VGGGAAGVNAATRVLRGNALGQPQIINMLPDDRVKPGERVITSGGDQIYPRGLPVGVVDRVVADTQNPPYLDILIKPAANLGHLEELLVITPGFGSHAGEGAGRIWSRVQPKGPPQVNGGHRISSLSVFPA